tara:strand:+ start:4242 stop:4502 length:261 start_codon:yes stop_codon:yes gene_type:complete
MHQNNESARIQVLESVLAERERQDQLWGKQNHPDAWWNVIASEEHGEVAREVYEKNEPKLLIEVIQACAVYFAWAEAILTRSKEGR